MRTKIKILAAVTASVALAGVFQLIPAQDEQEKQAKPDVSLANVPEPMKTIRMAADALDVIRWSDVGAGAVRLPGVDATRTMEFQAAGTVNGEEADFHESLCYNPPAIRVEETAGGTHTFKVASGKYAWDESELGGGLLPGKGTAMPMTKADKERMLQLWILPYGIVKAASAAGNEAKASMQNGMHTLIFPLSGELAGVTVTATLDDKGLITKVVTKSSDQALNVQAEYSDYADHGTIQSDVQSPGHIVETRDGKPFLDLQIKNWDANNPYLVFPVPENVKKSEG